MAELVRARVLLAAGHRREAAVAVAAALAIEPDDPELLGFCATLRRTGGDTRRAIEDYDRALSKGIREELHLGKAQALVALGEYHSALAEWSWALRRDPGLPEGYLGRAGTYFLLGDWDLGLADLEQAAAWGHGDPRIEASVTLSYLECLPMRPERFPRFLAHLRRAAADLWRSLDARRHLAARGGVE